MPAGYQVLKIGLPDIQLGRSRPRPSSPHRGEAARVLRCGRIYYWSAGSFTDPSMPLNIAVGDIARATVRSQLNDQAGENVLYYTCLSIAGGSANYQDFADGLFALLSPLYAALEVSAASVEFVECQRFFPGPLAAAFRSLAPFVPGAVTGNPIPAQVSGLIAKKTVLAGRHQQGRVYVPFPGVTDDTAIGRPQNSYVTRLDTLATALQTPYTVGTLPNTALMVPVLVNRSVPIGPGAVTVIDLMFGRPLWATQRRRGDYGATNRLI